MKTIITNEKKNASKNTNKKMIMKVMALLLAATACTMALTACGGQKETSQEAGLSQYETDYIGDNASVVNIVNHQEYKGCTYESIEIQSETEPYGLTVFVKVDPESGEAIDFSENAATTFDLIHNMGTLQYVDVDTQEVLESFNRE